jgi:hypothetical protein
MWPLPEIYAKITSYVLVLSKSTLPHQSENPILLLNSVLLGFATFAAERKLYRSS